MKPLNFTTSENTPKMSGHHHHHHGGHCHGHGEDGHDHSDDITPAVQSLLYSQIQFDSIVTLNGTRNDPDHLRTGVTDRTQRLLRNPVLPLFRKHGTRDSMINPNSKVMRMSSCSCIFRACCPPPWLFAVPNSTPPPPLTSSYSNCTTFRR